MDAFENARPRLFGIAYRMLGSRAEAEDVVQDTWLRWREVDASTVLDANAFLATIATRLAINALTSARSRRESYAGPWLPEPIASDDPHLGAERREALGIGVLMLLERLSPKERAAYVLSEAFDYSYARIAEILEVTEANARQLATRARQHLADSQRKQVGAEEQSRFLHAFLAAAQKGDVAALEQMLAADVVSYSDGGPNVRAARMPVEGRAAVAKFIASFATKLWDERVTGSPSMLNGGPALELRRDGVTFGILALDASADGIDRIFWVLNPEKLPVSA